MACKVVKISNLSLSATEQDIKEFFSFSGAIEHFEIQSDSERSQIAFLTFKEPQGAETAVLLSGATIVDQSVAIELAPNYRSPAASAILFGTDGSAAETAIRKAEDVVSSMLAKGFILGKDAVNRAKAFDEKLQLTSTAASGVTSLDKKIGISDKISVGTTIVSGKFKEVDEKFGVTDTTKSALAMAEQTVTTAGSAIMKNRYVLTGVSWATSAFSTIAKAAVDVEQKTKDKVLAQEEQARAAQGYAPLDESDGSNAATIHHTSHP